MYNLFEDEDDIFQGSPKSKFMDIVFNANRDLVQNELDRLMRRLAAMELLLQETHGEDGIDRVIKSMDFERADEIEMMAKNLYLTSVGNVLTQNE
ncbi:Domain of unknown function DUF2018 [Sulfuricurvum kujiense DSM 16994]|uniref:DUF2018 domain-containing protein n=1 Tax=Sulfuricurvum kujiense (strain ATCC BAA-921 / DSM 16994 / JCM 11577 / YK-1) TaxID=709032 RepID=E4U282_SULKY|nr:DUF2018 family protein [Sulfuricurvum kujiense]ADR33532.1 Domain of unknown function DUF2018 [Sulfuricurvum kujiense DSM 16994]